VLVVWSTYDIETIVAGLISIKDQDVYVIMMNIMYLFYMVSQGIQQGTVTLVGNMVGSGRISTA